MHRYTRVFLAAVLLLPFSPIFAENDLVLGAGWFDFVRDNNPSTNFSAEWRGNKFFYDLRPVIGASVNTDGGVYGYAGLDYDWEFVPHWLLVPGLDVGAYSRGSSVDLGGTFEFHESIELDYRFDSNYRVGVQASHTSNADIYNSNPGVDTLMAVFSIPL